MNTRIIILIIAICGVNMLSVATSAGNQLKSPQLVEVSKPKLTKKQNIFPRLQTTNKVPRKFKNIPFISPFPIPKATTSEQRRGFILFSRSITQPVYRKAHPLPSERISKLSNFATLGEYEPLTFSIYPLRNMKNFRVIVSDLKSPHGSINKHNIDLRLTTYWKMRYPMYMSKSYREVPELLEKVSVNSFAKGDCQRYWLTVHVPDNAKPGLYSGSVTIFDDIAKNAVKLPITFRVLPYKLLKDPQKHFTAFYPSFSHMFRAYSGALVDKAITTDLTNMQKYGFDIFPVFYLNSRKGKDGTGEFYIKTNDKRTITKAIQLGFKGRIILVNGTSYFYKRYCPNGKIIGGHGKMSEYPEQGSGYYAAITRAVKKFTIKCKKRGWPKILFFPFDEPRADNAEFCAKTYAAFKKGGAKTIITNDPTSSYAHFYRKANGLDIWCSQAFAIPYEKVITDKRYTYWSYPNHNSGELKDRVIMQKGGRMTYGYGLWRSGYQTLMPWAWRWFPGSGHLDQFNYFNYKASGTANRLDENANFIPAVNWECFREGYDDGRYLYTLQQAMTARSKYKDSQCQKLIAEGQQLLNKLWQRIPPHKKYLSCNFINDDEFKNLRWEIAKLTMQLLKYNGKQGVVAPSVMADTKLKNKTKDDAWFIKQAIKNKTLTYYNMAHNNFSGWHPTRDRELKFYVKNGTMYLDLAVNHKIDGAHPKTNKYPIGWPYVYYNLQPDKINIENYDLFYCKIKFSSNRDAVANDVTRLRFVFRKPKGQRETGPTLDLGGNENVWKAVYIPLKTPQIKNIIEILLLPYEGYYPDQTKIIFSVSEIGLIKFKQPIIKQIDSVNILLSSDKCLKVRITGYALKKGADEGYQCEIKLINSQQKVISKLRQALQESFRATLPLKELSPGKYKLELTMYDKSGKQKSQNIKNINVISSYQ